MMVDASKVNSDYCLADYCSELKLLKSDKQTPPLRKINQLERLSTQV